jgi:hypothetical protein
MRELALFAAALANWNHAVTTFARGGVTAAVVVQCNLPQKWFPQKETSAVALLLRSSFDLGFSPESYHGQTRRPSQLRAQSHCPHYEAML